MSFLKKLWSFGSLLSFPDPFVIFTHAKKPTK